MADQSTSSHEHTGSKSVDPRLNYITEVTEFLKNSSGPVVPRNHGELVVFEACVLGGEALKTKNGYVYIKEPVGQCWFCNSSPAEHSSKLIVPLYRITQKNYTLMFLGAAQCKYVTAKYPIPRCPDCERNHRRWLGLIGWWAAGNRGVDYPEVRSLISQGWQVGDGPTKGDMMSWRFRGSTI